jgi:CRISPR/Cas system-associated endoribonuclease Cas2
MKHFIFILLLSCLAFYPAYSQNTYDNIKQKEQKMSRAERKAAKAAEIAKEVAKCITDKKIYIEVYKIFPQGDSPKIVSGSYTVRLSHDSLTCYLPYYGSSKTPVFGGQNQAIEANKQLVQSNSSYDQTSESHIIIFSLKNENTMEKWNCKIQIFNNKVTYIALDTPSKSNITYTGEIITEK